LFKYKNSLLANLLGKYSSIYLMNKLLGKR